MLVDSTTFGLLIHALQHTLIPKLQQKKMRIQGNAFLLDVPTLFGNLANLTALQLISVVK